MKILKVIKNYIKYKWLTGHFSIGNLTVFGRNSMHWGVRLHTKKYGYICTRLPFFCFGKWWALYYYLSPDGRPTTSTYFIGKKHDVESWSTARLRYKYLGHNFNYESNRSTCQAIRYFAPGNNNEMLDIVRRSKSEIKEFSIDSKVKFDEVLMSDINRYLSIYGSEENKNEL